MTKAEQRRFTKVLVDNVRTSLLNEKCFLYPDSWGPLEIRKYVSEQFELAVFKMSFEQLEEYHKTLQSTNL